MPGIALDIIRLAPAPDLRLSGTVTDAEGRPLARKVILYDAYGAPVAQAWSSDWDGSVSFTLSGRSAGERFVARALGRSGECDAISCAVRGATS